MTKDELDGGQTPAVVSRRKRYDIVRKAERRRIAWKMRVDGCSLQEIADHIEVSVKTVSKYIREGLNAVIEETRCSAEEYRQMELQRLDGLLAKWYPLATADSLSIASKDRKGEDILREDDIETGLKASALVLKILERRSRLLGLDGLENREMKSVQEMPLEQLADEVRERSPLLLAAYANREISDESEQREKNAGSGED